MTDPQERPWSNNPNAPKIPHSWYDTEKATLAGSFVSSILYGILIVLFFKCISALLNPTHRKREGIKWGLVSYTVATFSLATAYVAITLNLQSLAFIDNREYTDPDGTLLGPLGYRSAIRLTVIDAVPNLMFCLNNLLADGLLLYRCYLIYAMNPWVIVLPCLIHLAAFAMGIVVFVDQTFGLLDWTPIVKHFAIPYLSISVSLNVLLTFMIVARLILHGRKVRTIMGSPAGVGGLYKTVVAMLIESSALYAATSLLVIGTTFGENSTQVVYFPILVETQAIAPLLIIQRVANRSALTSDTISPGTISSFRARSRGELTNDNATPPGGYSVYKYKNIPRRAETTIDSHRTSVEA